MQKRSLIVIPAGIVLFAVVGAPGFWGLSAIRSGCIIDDACNAPVHYLGFMSRERKMAQTFQQMEMTVSGKLRSLFTETGRCLQVL
jgi:hypothetical protein